MEKTMNYIDAMDFLEETKKYGSQLGLTSIQNLMAELGNIQDKITGTHRWDKWKRFCGRYAFPGLDRSRISRGQILYAGCICL